jgi:hypothetical protein
LQWLKIGTTGKLALLVSYNIMAILDVWLKLRRKRYDSMAWRERLKQPPKAGK